ncbi:MAG: SprB repeat-containing protein, partial [Flavobacteriales bacterium]|nr:SprB repeat-containing protein [Flavobacteriales bacterium]
MKHTLLSLAVILFGLGSAFGQTTLDLELNAIPSPDPGSGFFEVHLSFNVLPDLMGTGNEMGSGWETYDPLYTFEMFPMVTITTEYYWEESITNLSMYVAVICGEDTTILPQIDFESNTPTDIVYVASVDVGCGFTGAEWDCPELMSNFGWGCQDGWGIIDENCDCVEYIEPENCLEGLDTGLLSLYAIMECVNPDNLDAWWYCGLAESIAAGNAGDEEACADVWAWVEANDWDGTWDPGKGGNDDLDCPELLGNIGDWCSAANGGLGEISADCECIEISDCDLTVETNLLSIDDGTGSGSVEAIASGGTPPYVYVWT